MSDDTAVVMAVNIHNNLLNSGFNMNCMKTELVPRSKHNTSQL